MTAVFLCLLFVARARRRAGRTVAAAGTLPLLFVLNHFPNDQSDYDNKHSRCYYRAEIFNDKAHDLFPFKALSDPYFLFKLGSFFVRSEEKPDETNYYSYCKDQSEDAHISCESISDLIYGK